MTAQDLPLPGLKLIQPKVFHDSRGFVFESYRQEEYVRSGIDCAFVQDNHSCSGARALRGLHYQERPGQAKLVRVSNGRIFDVAVDLRVASPTFGRWHGVYLDSEQHQQLFIPVGFAHGFCVVSETADVLYKLSAPYRPETERTLRWDDPEVAVVWPVAEPILSARDRNGESFADFRRRIGPAGE